MYKYFSMDELKCQHCGEQGMDGEFMTKVEALRHDLGFPFTVTSAYRCKDHIIERKKKTPELLDDCLKRSHRACDGPVRQVHRGQGSEGCVGA